MHKKLDFENKEIKLWKQMGTLASVILFIILIIRQDWSKILIVATNISIWMIIVLFIGFILVQTLNALRWHFLLRSHQKKWHFWMTLKVFLAGNFASNFLPSTIGGDTLRITALIRYSNDTASALSSVILDRLLNVTSMLMFFPVSWFVFGSELKNLSVGNLLASWMLFPSYRGKESKLIRKLARFRRSSYDMWKSYRIEIIKSLGIALLSNFLSMFCVWILAISMEIPITFIQSMAVSVVSYLVTLLPISVNGYGIRETIYTILYVSMGATLEASTAFAILSRFILVLSTLPGAFFFPKVLSEPIE